MNDRHKIVIVDIDGTIADCSHRLNYIENEPRDYKAFYDNLVYDKPISHIIDLIRTLYKSTEYLIFIVTGRPDNYIKETRSWLSNNSVPYDHIFMRPSGDFRKDYVIKKEILEQIRTKFGEPDFVLDDRSTVVNMWRKNGVPCLQVAAGDFDKPKYANRPGKLVLLVGPSGAGKSTYAKNYTFDFHGELLSWTPNQIISSDDIREELCGDFQDQSKNEQVFVALHNIVKARIESGLLTVVDATNIRNSDRKSLLDLVPRNAEIEYHVIDRLLKEKLKTGGWRLNIKNKGINLIERHDQIFKSNIEAILAGDYDSRVSVIDKRIYTNAT